MARAANTKVGVFISHQPNARVKAGTVAQPNINTARKR